MSKFICLAILTSLLIVVPTTNIGAQKESQEELFFNANRAYRANHFQEASQGYDKLIRSGHENGHLYYNLGNACFKLGRLGPAILNYERALLLIPRDADLNFNLGYARDQTLDAIAVRRGLTSMTFFWLDALSLSEISWTFAVLNSLFWGILLLRLFHRTEWTYYASIVVLIFWIIAGISFGMKWYQRKIDDRAVIIDKEISILAGPNVDDTILFKLHAGTVVHYERSEDGWALVHLPDKKRGWVKAEAIECIKKKPVTADNYK